MNREIVSVVLAATSGLFLGSVGSILAARAQQRRGSSRAGRASREILERAREEAADIRRQAELQSKIELFERREQSEREIEERRSEIRERERSLDRRSDALESKGEALARLQAQLDDRGVELEGRIGEADRVRDELAEALGEQAEALRRIARLSPEVARAEYMERVERELSGEYGRLVLEHEQRFKQAADRESRRLLSLAIQRHAAGHTAETTVSTVDVPSEEIKGRIIGRDGRNIRCFEQATGVDVIIDDTPGIVVLSSFDPIRREAARGAMEALILDGRIHPARIEEIVEEARAQLDRRVEAAGQEALREADLVASEPRLIRALGALRFRTSYSQNVLQHSLEVAFLTGMLAGELGLDERLGRRCGLLHDIGKAIDHEVEGPHTKVGADLLRRCGEGEEVIDAALRHHDDLRVDASLLTVLVAAADAVSASRPGARRETLERFVKRMEELEGLALGFPGVEHAHAIQAGREVRVIVDSEQLADEETARLSRELARAIGEQVTFPGEVKVTVVRETRAVAFAR